MLFRFMLALFCAFVALSGYSQKKADVINFIPVSPDAAALGKFGNVPVSYYVGLPSIEIPLYTVEQNSLSVPVKLSYHAGGVRLSEIASWVGLGFALNAGGTITRNERGLADTYGTKGYFGFDKNIAPGVLNIADYYKSAKGELDLEADEYTFNVAGASGRFVLDRQAKPLIIPHQPVKIYPLDYNGNIYNAADVLAGAIWSWRIVNADGVQYLFKEIETTESADPDRGLVDYTTAWNLSMIVSANKEDTVFLDYEDGGYTVNMPISQSQRYFIKSFFGYCSDASSPIMNNYRSTHFLTRRLRKIRFKNGSVEFVPGPGPGGRLDALGAVWLDKIIVRNDQGELVKEVQFNYGYMRRNEIKPVSEFTQTENGLRLMLLSLQETGKQPYDFEYIHDLGLPDRFSHKQDHWGFHNNNPGTSLVPSRVGGLGGGPTLLGLEREASTAHGKQGTISKITYPTGGTTEFAYEGHSVALSSAGGFPEFISSYEVVDHGDRTIRVNYGNSNRVMGTFTTNNGSGVTTISMKTDSVVDASMAYFEILNAAGESMPITRGDRNGPVVPYTCHNLLNGTYRIFARNRDFETGEVTQTYPLTIFSYKEIYEIPPSTNPRASRVIGGLRVQRIVDTDPVTGSTLSREFTYSLGKLVWGVKYGSRREEYVCAEEQTEPTNWLQYDINEYEVFAASSNYPLSNTQGSPVGYDTVTVREYSVLPNGVRKENGCTIYEYTSPRLYKDEVFPSFSQAGYADPDNPIQDPVLPYNDGTTDAVFQFPYAPPNSKDWMRGQLLRTTMRKSKEGGGYEDVRIETNNYGFYPSGRSVTSVRCGLIFDAAFNNRRYYNGPQDKVAFSFYTVSGGYLLLNSKTVEEFDGPSRKLTSTVTYDYGNTDHMLPTEIRSTNSDGERSVEVNAYPPDYAPGTAFVDALVSENNVVNPIESVSYREFPDGRKNVLSGTIYIYKNNNKGQLDSVLVFENNTPLLLQDFKFSNGGPGLSPWDPKKTAFRADSHYVGRVFYSKYDRGALVDQRKSDDVPLSYVWDYGNKIVAASAVNATSQRIAYSSFEADGTSWIRTGGNIVTTAAFTGTKAWELLSGSNLRKSALPVDSYLVSYWSRNGSMTVNGTLGTVGGTKNGWTYYEHRLASVTSITLTGTGVIDEVRLHPVTARMTSYTHRPLIGVSSVVDENAMPTYYQYDNAGRLEAIRDADGNIVRHFVYHYMGR